MDLEDIILNKSNGERNTVRSHLYVESKKQTNSRIPDIKKEIRFAVIRGKRWGKRELRKGGQNVSISSLR